MDYDIFISHASEDKDSVSRPLALALRQLGYSIWYDEFTLKLGDSLRRSIDAGLARSKYGVVVLSPAFLEKNWPKYELDGLIQRENSKGQKVILPVWHNVDRVTVTTYSPSLADRVAASSSIGINAIADKIAEVLGPIDLNNTEMSRPALSFSLPAQSRSAQQSVPLKLTFGQRCLGAFWIFWGEHPADHYQIKLKHISRRVFWWLTKIVSYTAILPLLLFMSSSREEFLERRESLGPFVSIVGLIVFLFIILGTGSALEYLKEPTEHPEILNDSSVENLLWDTASSRRWRAAAGALLAIEILCVIAKYYLGWPVQW
jgi:hypothetical protein